MRSSCIVTLTIALALTGCAHKKHVRLTAPHPIDGRIGQTEDGIASWYGHPYHGRPAADGEIYDMEKMVAAHRTLPFHTWVRVYNLDNNKTTEVEIIDRGPFIDGRIIDLSHAAAQVVAMIGPGTARVRIEVIAAPPAAVTGAGARFAVQVGAFREKKTAEKVRSEMAGRYGSAKLVPRAGSPAVWRVLVGDESSEEGANALAGQIRKQGGERTAAFVVRLDS
jgi:rare lipoprotein A